MGAKIFARVLLCVAWTIAVGALAWFYLVGPTQHMAGLWIPMLLFSLGTQLGLLPWLMTRGWDF